jgi:hypothetical protein
MPFPRLPILPAAALLAALPAMPGSIEITNIRTFAIPFANFSDDVSINDNGDIVGSSFDVAQNINAAGFLIPGNGGSPVQIKYPGASNTYVYGINNQGVAVGYALNSVYVGFTEKNGSFTTFHAGVYTYSDAINNNGDITGYGGPLDDSNIAFLLKNGAQTNFSVPGYPSETSPAGINDSDQITGFYNFSSVNQGFLRNPDGSFQFFGFRASGINDAGIIVGASPGPNNTAIGDVRIGGTTYTYQFPGAGNTVLDGINNLDEVVGVYSDNLGFSETIFEGRLVYTNTPEPSTLSFCACALGALFAIGRRRRSWY